MTMIDGRLRYVCAYFAEFSAKNRGHRTSRTDCRIYLNLCGAVISRKICISIVIFVQINVKRVISETHVAPIFVFLLVFRVTYARLCSLVILSKCTKQECQLDSMSVPYYLMISDLA